MQMTKEEQVQMIQISSQQARDKVELMDALEKLEKNREFKKVFKDYYLKQYALRLVELKVAPSMQEPAQQEFIKGTLDAIGRMSQFMIFVHQEGMRAKDLLEQNEAEMDLLESENEEDI